jgi:hypothetical protein
VERLRQLIGFSVVASTFAGTETAGGGLVVRLAPPSGLDLLAPRRGVKFRPMIRLKD